MDTTVQDTNRFEMWCRVLGEEYRTALRNEKKHMKAKFNSSIECVPIMNSLAHSECKPSSGLNWKQPLEVKQKEEKEEVMSSYANVAVVADGFSQDRSRIDHLNNRRRALRSDKYEAAAVKYGVADDKAPKGAEETVARIKAGKYIIQTVETWRGKTTEFVWRDPSVKEDFAGYKTAQEIIDQQATAVKDAIFCLDAAGALAAVQEFEQTDLP